MFGISCIVVDGEEPTIKNWVMFKILAVTLYLEFKQVKETAKEI